MSQKQPMHVSSHDPTATLTGSTFGCSGTSRLPGAGHMVKKEGANWGPRYEDRVARTSYLKKKAPKEVTQPANAFKYSAEQRKKSEIPDRNSIPVMGIRTNKNYITSNAVEAILAAPRITKPVDRNYMGKEDFGKVPSYLTQVKEEIRRENEMIDRYVKDRMGYEVSCDHLF